MGDAQDLVDDPSVERRQAPASRIRLLVVEDNAVDCLLVSRALATDAGLQAEAVMAHRLGEALDKLRDSRFDLVILDLGLIESEGLDTYRRVRAADGHIPIIVLTGLEDEMVGEMAVREGAQDYLIKNELRGKALIRSIRYAIDRSHLEARLRQSQRLEAIGQLAGGIAHDFNNLLSVIQGHTCALQDGLTPDESAESLSEILEATERAANLTRQLLAFSRRQAVAMQLLECNQVILGVSRMLRSLLPQTIQLDLRLTSEASSIRADPWMMEQVLVNLVVNARDAMPDGGELRLATARLDGCRPPHRQPQPCLRLLVSDSGCGIPSENLSRICEPFFTTKEVGKGTGLGLATVYGILEQHEGWLEVESCPGKGTAMSVFLPFRAE